MNLEELRKKQASFEGNRQELQKEVRKLEKLRNDFVKKYSYEKIKELPIEKYVVGHGDKDTFCYWIETKLMELGKIKGGTTAERKFGVYFSKKYNKYITIPKWGENGYVAFEKIKKSILALLEAGKAGNIRKIKTSPLSPMFKGKILSTYFPEKYLNIFSEAHLDHYISELGIEDPNLKGEIDKRKHLMDFKNDDSVMKDWSIYEFSNFLYNQIGRPIKGKSDNKWGQSSKREVVSSKIKEYLEIDYEIIRRVKPEFVDFDIKGKIVSNENESKTTHSGKKADFEKENRRNKRLGERGEDVVVLAEQNYLKKIGRKDLSEKVKQVSKKDDSLGYDVLSYNEDGTEKYIEVKSTKSKMGTANFIISENQIRKSKSLENFYVYIVFEANTKNPKIWRIKKPFNLPKNKINITPDNYRVIIEPEV
jgi:hypothetical protein